LQFLSQLLLVTKPQKEVKTAYVDTSVLMKEYTEAKDLEAKYKAQSEEKGDN
jgi:outer membrane protein